MVARTSALLLAGLVLLAGAAQGSSLQTSAGHSEAVTADGGRDAPLSLNEWVTTPECEPQLCAICAVQAYLDCRAKGSSVASFECVGYGIPPLICMCLYTCNADQGVIDRVLKPQDRVAETRGGDVQ